MISVRVLTMGDSAVLAELQSIDEVLALIAAVRETLTAAGESVEFVPGARTVLVRARPGTDLDTVRAAIGAAALTIEPATVGATPPVGDVVEIPVRYDGPDLGEVARLCALTEAEVVAAHTGTPWRVAFGGFAPGFAYLVGGDPRLEVPRRAEPRTRVPAGSVALAGEFSGVYPRTSPGGWQLIGTSDVVLWDAERTPPALLQPGTWVRFVALPPT
ncbi:MAG TPA: allophanate hydrolase subunit 1 [Intrasporangiaceae bacterium]|nr:allophanate hydrolase subunit 1 [Intrasporangiaceae bacterium]